MMTCSANNIKEEVCPEIKLLNQACLDLVCQIEELQKENVWLKERIKELKEEGKSSGLGNR